jgi:hypothetical protein
MMALVATQTTPCVRNANPFLMLPSDILTNIKVLAYHPTPTALLMKRVEIQWRVFECSGRFAITSPPGRKVIIQAWDLDNPRRTSDFKIFDIPLDTEPSYWRRYSRGDKDFG